MLTIGIDVGGTLIRAAAIDSVGRILSSRRAPTPRTVDGFREWIVHAVHHIREDSANRTVVAVGLALPGVVDRDRGVLIRSVNLSFLEGRPIVHELTPRLATRVELCTDADAATWGEYWACTPRPMAFVHLRLGTGIASGIVVDNRLQPTDPDRTTHWEVLVVDHRPDAPLCPCGMRGCLETIASGPALEGQEAEMGYENGSTGLQSAWERDEPLARMIVDRSAAALVSAICNLKSHIQDCPLPHGRGSDPTISPEIVICLGGGVLTALPCLFEQTAKRLRSFDDDFTRCVAVHPSRLGDDAGVIGAATLARV